MVLIPSTITSVRIFIPCEIKTAVSKTRIVSFLYFVCQFVHLTIV